MRFFRLTKQIFRYINESPSNKGQKLYRFFLAILWQVYKRTVGLPLVSKLDNGASFILLPNSTNSTGNIYVKTYEAEYIYFLRKQVERGGVLLDIGAHMGLYTLLLKDRFSAGYCFEPAGDNFRALRNNMALNELTNVFECINMAVSNMNGEASLEITGAYSGMNGLTDRTGSAATVTVKTTTVDSFVKERDIEEKITLIKIDTEGHEVNVLKGARETLRNNPATLVLFENSELPSIIRIFDELSFTVYGIRKDGTPSRRPVDLASSYNLVAVGPHHPLQKQ
ncbi:FkbM family methyltransferase [Flavisolibacter sp. BT320]|nr:FkbM family methyltransferase [Flavisolibacter longurius]